MAGLYLVRATTQGLFGYPRISGVEWVKQAETDTYKGEEYGGQDMSELTTGGQFLVRGEADPRFRQALTELKNQGALILAAGDVQDTAFRRVCRRQMGSVDHTPQRVRTLLQLSNLPSDQGASGWLPGELTFESEDAHRVDLRDFDRSGTASLPTDGGVEPVKPSETTSWGVAVQPDWSPETDHGKSDLPLSERVNWDVSRIASQYASLNNGQLRVGLWSADTIVDDYGLDEAKAVIETLRNIMTNMEGMGFVFVPRPASNSVVEELSELSDALVRYQWDNGNNYIQRKWFIESATLDGRTYETPWMSF